MIILFRSFTVVLLSLLLISVAGCSRTKPSESAVAVSDRSSDEGDDTVRSFQGDDPKGISFRDIDDALNVRVIYFDYDSSTITAEQNNIVAAHSQYLASNPEVRVTLEGHADERGSREYNLALGERRAIAVKRQFVLLGVAEKQILSKSYGEERPVARGDNELAWQQNRRVEIIY